MMERKGMGFREAAKKLEENVPTVATEGAGESPTEAAQLSSQD
jgi:hypothetical protein